MPVSMKGNYIFVEKGSKCYETSSNYTNYIELGRKGITDYYLEARIEDGEFKISGVLLDENGAELCHLNDNFISESEVCSKEMTQTGYRIKDEEGTLIFEIEVENTVCHLKGTIYDESGDVVAEDRGGSFVILKSPAVLGKNNGSIGIKLG